MADSGKLREERLGDPVIALKTFMQRYDVCRVSRLEGKGYQ